MHTYYLNNTAYKSTCAVQYIKSVLIIKDLQYSPPRKHIWGCSVGVLWSQKSSRGGLYDWSQNTVHIKNYYPLKFTKYPYCVKALHIIKSLTWTAVFSLAVVLLVPSCDLLKIDKKEYIVFWDELPVNLFHIVLWHRLVDVRLTFMAVREEICPSMYILPVEPVQRNARIFSHSTCKWAHVCSPKIFCQTPYHRHTETMFLSSRHRPTIKSRPQQLIFFFRAVGGSYQFALYRHLQITYRSTHHIAWYLSVNIFISFLSWIVLLIIKTLFEYQHNLI